MKKPLSLFFLLFFLVPLSAQINLEEALANYRQRYLPEKIFVHTDKSIYAAGETLWAAVYQVDAQSHFSDSLSRIIYLELRSPTDEMLLQRKLYPRDGHTYGDLSLPASLAPGTYQLTAYTRYQRNAGIPYLFRKAIRILPGLKESGGVTAPAVATTNGEPTKTGNPEFELRFFPEGGDCIDGVPCRVAFTAARPDGSPLQISGYVANELGETVTVFQTTPTGVGTFNYTPRIGQDIRVFAGKGQRQFQLPDALQEGYHLNVLERKDSIRLSVRSNVPEGLAGATLLLHIRGVPLLTRKIDERRDRILFTLPVNDLPAGVLTATLLNPWDEPMAERLFYIAPAETTLQIQPDTTHYAKRSEVDLFIKMPYLDAVVDSLSRGRISLSVVPAAAFGGPEGDDIRSWLLLNSDLDRPVPYAPELLFATEERERQRRIEDYLLTREWRRFDWKAITDDQPFKPEFLLEQGIYLRGRMTNYENEDKARPGKVFLSRLENGYSEETLTNENGDFSFGPYLIYDTLAVAVQGRFKPGKRNRLSDKIDLDDNPYVKLITGDPAPPSLPAVPQFDTTAGEPELIELYEDISQRSLTVSRNFDSLIIDLDVVDVVTKRIDPIQEERNGRTALYGGVPDNRILVDDIPWAVTARSAFELLRTVPGVLVTGNPGAERIQIRGQTSIVLSSDPAFFIDGINVTIDAVRDFPVQNIEFVDVIKGARAAIFGINGANGAVLLYSRRGGPLNTTPEPGLLNTSVLGYYKARQFAVFDASLPENRNRPDFRTTLHWNPDLRTNVLGLARDAILTSDQTGKYIIVAQGLRKDGRPFYGTGEFFVE